jgi:F0F1-type ATP synthase assembly protein I
MNDQGRLDRIDERLDKLDTKLDALSERMASQRGYVAGFASAFTFLASTVVGLVIYIWKHLQ